MNGSKKPNLFIVGAPKCGTSALYTYLKAHPDIFMAPEKEPLYFGRDLPWPKPDDYSPEWYDSLFEGWGNEKYGGEASVWYLYSEEAAAEIKVFSPEARIIIMLRNPVDVIYALYYQMLHQGIENKMTLEDALSAESERRTVNKPKSADPMDQHHTLLYTDFVRFSDQVARYQAIFPADQLQVIWFDNFKKNTAETYRRVLQFLKVDPTFQPDFQIINPNQRIRSRLIWKTCHFPPQSLWRLIPAPDRPRLRRKLRKWNKKYNLAEAHRPPMNPATEAMLNGRLASEIIQLRQLLEIPV